MKHKVGDVVTVNAGFSHESTKTISEVKDYRKNGIDDVYYKFVEGDGAWGWSIQPTTELVRPEIAAMRIIDGFQGKVRWYQISSAQMPNGAHEWEATIILELVDQTIVTFAVWGNDENLVDTCRPSWNWDVYINDEFEANGTEDNLGAAIVNAYNSTLPQEI